MAATAGTVSIWVAVIFTGTSAESTWRRVIRCPTVQVELLTTCLPLPGAG
jgi:hypothetical protein